MNGMTITWEPSGRPVLHDPTSPLAQLSISHADDVCLAAVGTGPQGCDLQPVESRSLSDWIALLGVDRAGHLDQLVKGGDTTDVAGTRLWTAAEASIKALGTPTTSPMRIAGRDGAAVVLEVRHADRAPWRVFTSVVSLEPNRDHVIALGLGTGADEATLPALPDPALPPADPYAGRFELGDGARQRYVQALNVLVRDVPKPLGSVHFSSFAHWMGASREYAMRGIISRVEQDLRENKGKFVASGLTLRCLEPVGMGERLAVVLTTSSPDWDRGPYTFHWAFHRGDSAGPLVAQGRMNALWVVPARPGLYRVEPAPEYIRDHLICVDGPAAPIIEDDDELGPQLLTNTDESPLMATAAHDVDVAIDETDYQGHAHFVNYLRWQGAARDALLRSLGISMTDGGPVPLCRTSEVKFVRETLAFESVRVRATVAAVYSNGFDLRFAYESQNDSGDTTTVAVGRHRMSLVQQGHDGRLRPEAVPSAVLATLGLERDLVRAA